MSLKKARVTMQDIALRIGVTKMTVSRYFKNPDSVAKSTGEKIRQAVDELGFVPSRVPSMLSQSASKAIGIIIPSFSNMVFADVIRGVEDEAIKHGYTVLITHSGYDLKYEEREIAELLSYGVDGLILTEPLHSELSMRRIHSMAIPCVEIMSIPKKPLQYAVGLDHSDVMYRCTKALLMAGRKLPIYLGVRLDIRTMQRQSGYERAMREFGYQPFALDSALRSNFTLARGLMNEGLQQHPDIDAVLATNDDIAVGALLVYQERGIKIPDTISVLGYNGLNIGAATSPRLCSVLTPRYKIGRCAAQMIINDLTEHENVSERLVFPYAITAGQSVTSLELKLLQQQATENAQLLGAQNLPEICFDNVAEDGTADANGVERVS